MTTLSDDDFTHQVLKKEETLMVTGSGGTTFQRAMVGKHPAIILRHKELNKTVVITGDVLAGINGWLARFVREIQAHNNRQTRH